MDFNVAILLVVAIVSVTILSLHVIKYKYDINMRELELKYGATGEGQLEEATNKLKGLDSFANIKGS